MEVISDGWCNGLVVFWEWLGVITLHHYHKMQYIIINIDGSIHQFLLSYLSPHKVTHISHRCTSRYFFDLYLISKTKAVNTW